MAGVRVWVDTCAGHGGAELPRRIRLDGRQIDIVEVIDQWHGVDHRYYKASDGDGNLYILRFDETQAEWELTMFQRAGTQSASSESRTAK